MTETNNVTGRRNGIWLLTGSKTTDIEIELSSHSSKLSDSISGLLAALVVVICWSGFNIVSRLGGTTSFTPFDLAAMRYGVSGTLALPFFLRHVPVGEWPRYAVLALFGGLGYGILVYSGFVYAPAAHAGVFVNGGIPFWTVVIVVTLARFRIARQTVLALVVSAAGLLLIGFQSLFASPGQDEWIGDSLFVAAALSWAIFGLLMRRWNIRPQLGILGIASFSVLVYMPVYILWLPSQLKHADWDEIGLQCVYQGIIAALLAAGMYSYAVQKIGACRASMMLALVPALSAVGGFLILDEELETTTMLGIVVVSLGAVMGVLPADSMGRICTFSTARRQTTRMALKENVKPN